MIDIIWIDDQDISTHLSRARNFGFNIIYFTNWKDAEKYLNNKYDSVGAIIFDYHCKLHPNDVENNDFLRNALFQLSSINGRNNSFIPWFVLSAGSADGIDFSHQIDSDLINDRLRYDSDWTKGYYSKLIRTDLDALFNNIKKTVSKSDLYKIKNRYNEVFEVVDNREYFQQTTCSDTLVNLLINLHDNPTRLGRPSDAYNSLRQILEELFISMNKEGILPNDCFDRNNKPIMTNSLYYLNGGYSKVYDYEGKYIYKIWYNKGRLLPDIIYGNISFVKDLGDKFSHTRSYRGENEENKNEFDNNFNQNASYSLLFSCVLLLTEVLIWYGRYLNNPNRERDFSGMEIDYL